MLSQEQKENFLLEEIEQSDDLKTIVKAADNGPVIPDEIKNSLLTGNDRVQPDTKEIPFRDTPPALDEEIKTGSPEIKKEETPEDDKTKFSLSETIDAETVVSMLSWLMPILAILILSKFNKKIDKGQVRSDMELDDKEAATLEKPLQKILDQAEIGFKSPFMAFIVIFVIMFGLKLWAAHQSQQELQEDTEETEGEVIQSSPYTGNANVSQTKGKRGRKKGSTKEVLAAKKKEELQKIRNANAVQGSNQIPLPLNNKENV